MLILFDIDATLLRTEGAGLKAMHEAGRELFGEQFSMEGIEFSGRLDSLIFAVLMRIYNVRDGETHHDRFRQSYGRHLERLLSAQSCARLLPGVRELVHELADCEHACIGLLTGNYPETGRMKIRAAGLDPDLFAVAAWGCEGKSRRDLPPVAMRRHAERIGRSLPAEQVVIIGDTPHDIDCAKAHGCRSIGVATGMFSTDALAGCGADLVVPDLSGKAFLLQWLIGKSQALSI